MVMRVLLTGGTGYIGAAVLDRLISGGHQVTAVVRSAEKAHVVRARGTEPAIADLSDVDALHELAAASDGVIHVASPGDETSASVDEAAVGCFLRALGGTDRPFVHTTGLWLHGSGSAITESTAMNAPRLTAWRVPLAKLVRDARGVRTSVIAPAVVYGRGGGLLHLVAAGPRTAGNLPALTMVGPGDQHWSTVHVDDLAELYVLALEKAPPGSYFLGAGGVNPTVREITEAVSRAVGLAGRVEPEPVVQTLDRLGLLGEALLLDQQASGDTARRVLGWLPQGPSILDDIAHMDFGAHTDTDAVADF
ncbi:epimerase [Streptomyces alfalfae]|uniref:Epimerase n=2 Tax=Streptomyces alfalfae TaxID=1642299 RepID=A0ABM6H1T9_9ACTN|nr:epimerase [Streptomyces alfalfae]AYA20663.1 NAD-dependent epimerase/dehydratase family protein [Streptomyces fradiae]RXX34870.1 epimerase [Streptomyces alfalfae]RZM96137.1 NAD-dependent epimerase/dehydratase family protein [Streptomyces alfalfae]